MTLLGIFGILISFLAFPFAIRSPDRRRQIVFFALCIAHIATCIFYYEWQKTNTSDSPLYYYDIYGFYGTGFQLNTFFVIYLVQFMKSIVGGSYLDYFMLFQAIGFWAIAFMMRIFEEIYEDLGVEQPAWTLLILFLPSLHFWTSSIGKDGPLAFASAMAAWAALAISRRYLAFLVGAGIMLVFRPHIALVSIASLAIALLLDRRTKLQVRITLVGIVLVALAVVAASVRTTFSVDVMSAESIGDFLSSQAELSKEFDKGSAVLDASFPFRLFSLLFRPFFFDAGGVLGLVASLENLLIITAFLTFARNFALFRSTLREVFFFRYACIFSFSIILLLAVVYYNVGLGLRQRTMMLPTFLAMYVALRAVLAQRRSLLGRSSA